MSRCRISFSAIVRNTAGLGLLLVSTVSTAQQAVAREEGWDGAGWVVSVLLFGAICAFVSFLIGRRVAGKQRQQPPDETLSALRLTRDQLVRAQRLGNIGSWEVVPPGDRIVWSDQAFEIFGIQRADLGGTLEDYLQLVHPDDREWLRRHGDEWLETGGEFKAEYRVVRPDGEVRWVSARGEMVVEPDGTVTRSTGTIQDVTEDRRQQVRLRQLSEMLERSEDLCCIVDESARFQWVNRAYARMYGMDPEAFEGLGAEALVGEKHFGTEIAPRLEAALAGEPQHFETERDLPGLGTRHLLARHYPIDLPGESRKYVGVTITDITEIHATEAERRRLERRLATMLESVTDAFLAFDDQWRCTYINSAGARLIDSSADEVLGKPLRQTRIPELDSGSLEMAVQRALKFGDSTVAEEPFDIEGRSFELRAYPWEGGVAVFIRDVTEHHQMVEQLRAQQAALRASRDALDVTMKTRQAMINSLPANIAMLDTSGNVVDVNDQWRHFGEQNDSADPAFGIGSNYIELCEGARGDCAEEAGRVAQGLRKVISGETDSFELEYPCHSPHENRWFRVVFNSLESEDGEQIGVVAMHVDVTKRKEAEIELERIAFQDPFTGLPSRPGFSRNLQSLIDDIGWPQGGLVATLDIVRFRDINEAHGYAAGDRLLIEFAGRLRTEVGDDGLVGRIGSDHFIVYSPPHANLAVEERVAGMINVAEKPFDLDGVAVEIAVRIGYTQLGNTRRTVEELIQEAELASFESVETFSSRSSYFAFTPELAEQAHKRIQLTDELRRALEADEFELHFQPQVNLADGSMVGAEALLRWQHPQRGLQPPGLFIPIAEKSQLIDPRSLGIVRRVSPPPRLASRRARDRPCIGQCFARAVPDGRLSRQGQGSAERFRHPARFAVAGDHRKRIRGPFEKAAGPDARAARPRCASFAG